MSVIFHAWLALHLIRIAPPAILVWATIFIMAQGHWVGDRILPVFIRWAHSDPHDPRALFLIFLFIKINFKLFHFFISSYKYIWWVSKPSTPNRFHKEISRNPHLRTSHHRHLNSKMAGLYFKDFVRVKLRYTPNLEKKMMTWWWSQLIRFNSGETQEDHRTSTTGKEVGCF